MYPIINKILESNLIALIFETGRLILTSLNLPLTRPLPRWILWICFDNSILSILSKEPPEPFGVEINTM